MCILDEGLPLYRFYVFLLNLWVAVIFRSTDSISHALVVKRLIHKMKKAAAYKKIGRWKDCVEEMDKKWDPGVKKIPMDTGLNWPFPYPPLLVVDCM